jgi:phage/conjugal plasmid C-4 type zinc finger TraR family protein
MADVADIANDHAQYLLDVALHRRAAAVVRASAAICEDCEDPIPLLRQQKVPGCQTCVSCQGLRERRR